jgi:hypothetical protein
MRWLRQLRGRTSGGTLETERGRKTRSLLQQVHTLFWSEHGRIPFKECIKGGKCLTILLYTMRLAEPGEPSSKATETLGGERSG